MDESALNMSMNLYTAVKLALGRPQLLLRGNTYHIYPHWYGNTPDKGIRNGQTCEEVVGYSSNCPVLCERAYDDRVGHDNDED